MQQMADVDPPVLAETIDATDALLESQRIPRQFQRDDEAAALLQVEPLACRVG